ncbi:MAG: hypothetical protein M3352_01210 [Bacteroidota bacterium]|nr:hypothetical protein [Bacteroidota bacterium]
MNTRKHIQEELESLKSNLPYFIERPVFNLPEGYFDNFAASVFAKIKEGVAISATDELRELSPALASIKKEMPFNVPENYFSTLFNEVPLLIHDEEVSNLLANHHKTMPYEVPVDYFTNLPNSVLAKLSKPTAKVISIKRSNWMKMAVAATVAGIIAVSGIFYLNDKSSTIDPSKQPGQWVAKKLEGISNQTLDEFIKTADFNASENFAKTSGNSSDVRNMLKEVSDNELEAFLATMPNDDEELFIVN